MQFETGLVMRGMDTPRVFGEARLHRVVRYIAGDEFTGSVNTIEIFEKGGQKLLDLSILFSFKRR